MIKHRVAGSLFRSLLRWTRRPEVVASHFELDAAKIGVTSVLPPNAVVKNAEGTQAAIYHCFRALGPTQENIELGFRVLRELNASSASLMELTTARSKRLSPEAQAAAKFRIGQVVEYMGKKVRGVVCSWEIDASNTQIVEVLWDESDAFEFDVKLHYIRKLHAEYLRLVDDPQLHRISNSLIPRFFECYDPNRGRFLPTEEVRYWYAQDLEVLEKQEEGSAPLIPAEQLERLNRALHNTQSTVGAMGNVLHNIMHKHADVLSLSDVNSGQAGKKKTIAQQVLDDVGYCLAVCKDPTTARHVVLPHVPGSPLRPLAPDPPVVLYQALRRGGVYRQRPHPNNSANIDVIANRPFGSDLVKMSPEGIKNVYSALEGLGSCFWAVDQILQLRFQHRGIGYHEGLRLADASVPLLPPEALETEGGASSGIVSRLREVAAADDAVETLAAASREPPATFLVGQVVRHRKFNYRGVITGFNMRPQINMKEWDGIVGLQHGQEQPIYRVLVDEGDADDLLNTIFGNRVRMVAQENLELISDRSECVVRNKDLGTLLDAYDPSTGTYRVPHKLRYCFPLNHVRHAGQGRQDGEPAVSEAEVEAVYARIDEMLVEMLNVMRTSFSLTRAANQTLPGTTTTSAKKRNSRKGSTATTDSTAVVPLQQEGQAATLPVLAMEDLLMLMKYAQTRDQAMAVETLMWLVFVSHTDPAVNKLMRLCVAHAKRGNYLEAVDMAQRAAAIDPTFSEAHNKQASCYHLLKDYDECLEHAEKAVELFPSHFAALAGLGLSYEYKGMNQEAIQHLRKALEVHPYAAPIQTLLLSMLTASKASKGRRDTSDSVTARVASKDG